MRVAALVLAGWLAAVAPAHWDAVASGPRTAAVQRPSPFTLAVLRRDGIVVPFAAFDGRRWDTPWPETVTGQDLPISLDDVPDRWWGRIEPPERMALWREGVRIGDVALTGLTTIRLMCQPRLSLRSDYKPSAPLPPPFELPHPKDGLLVAGNATIGRVAAVPEGTQERTRAATVIAEDFNKAEDLAAAAFARWRHPFTSRERRQRPMAIEALYRGPTDALGWTAYFVEAVRQYPPGTEDKDGCGPATFGWGWILVGPKGRPRVRFSAQVTYCDRHGVSYMLPFGTVTADGKTYWVFQYSGFDAEWYEVMRPTPARLEAHASFHAGTCSP